MTSQVSGVGSSDSFAVSLRQIKPMTALYGEEVFELQIRGIKV